MSYWLLLLISMTGRKIVSGKYEALELIGGDKEMKELSPEIPFACALSGYGAAVWKIELKNFSKEIQKK